MLKKMIPPDQQHDIFNIFHDGDIESAQMKDGDCHLHVGIEYLAQRISPKLEGFDIQLQKPTDFHLEGWMREVGKGTSAISDFREIFSDDLEILSAKVEEGRIIVTCNIHNYESNWCGGTLSFKSEGAFVTDVLNRSYSLDDLDQLCKEYWDDWTSKHEHA